MRSILLLLLLPVAAVPQQESHAPVWPAGWIDGVSCEAGAIEGWAADARHPERHFSVAVYVDGIRISTEAAGTYRPDLDQGLAFGQGDYGFRAALPKRYYDGMSHVVSGVVIGTKHKLYGSMNFSCDAGPDVHAGS